jgi:hypothetical protein
MGEDRQAIESKPSQGKTVGKNYENRQGEPEESESIILGVEYLVESEPPVSSRKVRGTHLASPSRNRAVTGS